MRYGAPSMRGRTAATARGRLRSRARAAALPPICGEHDRCGARRGVRRDARACGACRRCAWSTPITTTPATSARWCRTSTITGSRTAGRTSWCCRSTACRGARSTAAILITASARKPAGCVATELGLKPEQYAVTFQSRFGRGEWLKPYTQPTLVALAKEGMRRVDVACPGFVSDCLETLEEIALEARAAFLKAGGKEFHAIPCLNEHPAWIGALADLALKNLGGWLDPPPDAAARELRQVARQGAGGRDLTPDPGRGRRRT